jgi:hypothetical protein
MRHFYVTAEIRHQSSVFKSTDQYHQSTDIQLSTRNRHLLHNQQCKFLVIRQMPLRQSQQSHSDKLSVKSTLHTPITWFPPKQISRVVLPPNFSTFQFHWGISYHTAVSTSEQVWGWHTDWFLPNPWHIIQCSITSASLLHASKLHTHVDQQGRAFMKTLTKLCGA